MKNILLMAFIPLNALTAQINKVDTVRYVDLNNKIEQIKIRSYDKNGNLIKNVLKDPAKYGFVNVAKLESKYDQKNRIIENVISDWKLGKWENAEKELFQYTQLGDTLVTQFRWKDNRWFTLLEFNEKYPYLSDTKIENDARSIKAFEGILRTNQMFPDEETIKMEYKYDKDHKVVGWRDNLNSRQRHINQLLQLGYEFLYVNAEDREKGSLVFRNCKTNHVCTLTIWYRYHLSITLEWFDNDLKPAITFFRGCN